MSILLVEIGLDLVRVPEMAPTTLEHRVRRLPIRDWSLITGRGATKREGEGGGHMKFYLQKGGRRKKFKPC